MERGERENGRERKQAPSALQSKLANVELSDLSVETILPEYAVPPPLTAVCTAALVELKWVFRHEKQSMTCAEQWRADDEPAPFDDGLSGCRRSYLFIFWSFF